MACMQLFYSMKRFPLIKYLHLEDFTFVHLFYQPVEKQNEDLLVLFLSRTRYRLSSSTCLLPLKHVDIRKVPSSMGLLS